MTARWVRLYADGDPHEVPTNPHTQAYKQLAGPTRMVPGLPATVPDPPVRRPVRNAASADGALPAPTAMPPPQARSLARDDHSRTAGTRALSAPSLTAHGELSLTRSVISIAPLRSAIPHGHQPPGAEPPPIKRPADHRQAGIIGHRPAPRAALENDARDLTVAREQAYPPARNPAIAPAAPRSQTRTTSTDTAHETPGVGCVS